MWRWPSSSPRRGSGPRGTEPPSAPADLGSAKTDRLKRAQITYRLHRGSIGRLASLQGAGQLTGVVQRSGFLLGCWWQETAVHHLQRRHQREAEGRALTLGAVADGAAGGVNLSDLHLPPKRHGNRLTESVSEHSGDTYQCVTVADMYTVRLLSLTLSFHSFKLAS